MSVVESRGTTVTDDERRWLDEIARLWAQLGHMDQGSSEYLDLHIRLLELQGEWMQVRVGKLQEQPQDQRALPRMRRLVHEIRLMLDERPLARCNWQPVRRSPRSRRRVARRASASRDGPGRSSEDDPPHDVAAAEAVA